MVSTGDGWAVGSDQSGGTVAALVEHWDGTSWTPLHGLDFAGYLAAVSADSDSDAWAVGSPARGAQPLLAHWNGMRWRQVTGADPGAGGGYLEAVSALSPTDAWAVGQRGRDEPKTFVEHWDGASWTLMATGDPGFINDLSGVDAISPQNVWAVGSTQESEQYQTLVEHWDGSQWTVVPSPAPHLASFLTGLTANSPSDVWAVGYSYIGKRSRTVPLALHWDGVRWNVVETPTAGDRLGTLLASVSMAGRSDGWTVGFNLDAGRRYMLRWDGDAWTKIKLANLGRMFGNYK